MSLHKSLIVHKGLDFNSQAVYSLQTLTYSPPITLSSSTAMDLPNNQSLPVLTLGAADLLELYRNHKSGSELPYGAHEYEASEFRRYIAGQYWLYPYQDIGLIGVRDFSIERGFISHGQLSNKLSLEYVLSGGSDMELNQKTLLNDGVPRLYLASYGPQGHQTRFHKSGESIRGLGLWLNTEKLMAHFKPQLERLPEGLTNILQLKTEGVFSASLSKPIKDTLEAIVAMSFEHHMAGLYLEAKITELLYHTFDSFYQMEHGLDANRQISQHKAKALAFVLQSINNNLAVQPDIDQLAREVGLSRSNLLSTFKHNVGVNFSDYLLQQRMETAQSLIKTARSTILETALAVGYNDQSAFGRAYKRYFGHSPRDDRP